jgi:hypothetical protein
MLSMGDAAKLTASLENALTDREHGTQYPFVIMLLSGRKIIGSTRFFDIEQAHKNLKSDGHGGIADSRT